MPAQVTVIEGAQVGWRYVVTGKLARVANDPGSPIALPDLAAGAGIELSQRITGYEVTNLLPHAIYVDGKALPVGESHTLHDGMVIQASPTVLLRFTLVGPVEGLAVQGVISLPPNARRSKNHRWLSVALVAVCLTGGLYLHRGQQANAARASQAEVQAREAKELLRTIQDRELSRFAYRAHHALTNGIYFESIGDFRRAIEQYQEAVQLVDLMAVEPRLADQQQALRATASFLRSKLTIGS